MAAHGGEQGTTTFPHEVATIGRHRVVAIRGRDLHAALGVSTAYADWIRRKAPKAGLRREVDFAPCYAKSGYANARDDFLTPLAALRLAEAGVREPPPVVLDAVAALIEAEPTGVVDATPRDEPEFSFPAVRRETVDGIGIDVVDMRELHASLGCGKLFNSWRLEKVEAYGIQTFRADHPASDNRLSSTEVTWLVTLATAKELAMLERTALGRAVRRYFIRCEERLHAEVAASAAQETTRLRLEVETLRKRADAIGPSPDGAQPGSDGREGADHDDPTPARVVADAMRFPGMTPDLLARIVDVVDRPRPAERIEPRRQEAKVDPTTGASPNMPPTHLHKTTVGIVIDLSLSGKAATTADREAAVMHAGCRFVDRRTFNFWKQAYEGRTQAEGRSPQLGEAEIDGMTLAMRRKAVEAYLVLTSERPVARKTWLDAARDARNQAIFEASWARRDRKVH